jgi:hypothetical protein
MFEAELEMERRSSFLPLLLMACLVAAIVGTVAYVVMQVRAKTPLSAQQASGMTTRETHITGCWKKQES